MSIPEKECHCFYAQTKEERANHAAGYRDIVRYFEDRKAVVDLGCGDGVFIELFRQMYPTKIVAGVDTNDELLALARQANPGSIIVKEDALAFLQLQGAVYDGFVMTDVVEHLDADVVMAILQAIPSGAKLYIRTPNTDSLLGHQFYLQEPTHKAAYCPTVLERMLSRAGFSIIARGERDGILFPGTPLGWLRRKILQLIFINEFSRIFGGGNYFVVAKKK